MQIKNIDAAIIVHAKSDMCFIELYYCLIVTVWYIFFSSMHVTVVAYKCIECKVYIFTTVFTFIILVWTVVLYYIGFVFHGIYLPNCHHEV